MAKAFAVLAAVLAALAALDWTLSRRDEDRRSSSSQVRQLVPPEKREAARVAVIRLDVPGRTGTLVYGRKKETWRCLSLFDAPADEARIRGLFEKLFNAQGIVQSRVRARAGDYGLAPGGALELSLHGPRAFQDPKGDRLVTIEVGASIPDGSGCYVKVPGKDEVIAIDADLREELSPAEGTALPPLVDPRVVPGGWPAGGGIRTIRVETEGGEKYALERREAKVTPEEMKAGRPPWDWFLLRDGKEESPQQILANSYSLYLKSATSTAILDPKTLATLGLDRPAARIVLGPSEGEPMEIVVGRKGDRPGVPLRNATSGALFEVSAETAGLLAPEAARLLEAASANPWDAALKAAQPSRPMGFFPR